jgi:hypothetical protein
MGSGNNPDPESRIAELLQARASYPNIEVGHPYDEVLCDVQASVERSGSVGKNDIGALMLWKRQNLSASWTCELNDMRDREVRAITGMATKLANDAALAIPDAAKAARERLRELPGCGSGQAVASTLLTVAAPQRMAVYDGRALTALARLGIQIPNRRYSVYMTIVCELARQVNNTQNVAWLPRDVDKALFMIGGGPTGDRDLSTSTGNGGRWRELEVHKIDSQRPPSLEDRIAYLRDRFRMNRVDVLDDVVTLIASHIAGRYFSGLDGAVTRILALASLNGTEIDMALAEMVLRDLAANLGAARTDLTTVIAVTAEYFGTTVEQLTGAGGPGALVHARQIAMYLCFELADLLLPEIGELFGRDHTAAMYSWRKIGYGMRERREVLDQVRELTIRIRGGRPDVG